MDIVRQLFPVALGTCSDYQTLLLDDRLSALSLAAGFSPPARGARVLLKPNLVSARGPSWACTNALFIRAVALWFLEQGAHVALGDSPAFGSALAVCEAHGISAALKDLNIPIVEFDRKESCRLSCGIEVGLARAALDCDLLVNLPKIKAHSQMYVSMAVKNCFGLITGLQKAMLHMKHGEGHERFSRLILDLQKFIPEQLVIGDGIEVMHHTGPIKGRKLSLGCLAVAQNSVAFDTAMLHVLGLPSEKSPLWQVSHRAGMAESNIEQIAFPGLPADFFSGAGFVAPANLDPIRFRFFRFICGMLRRLSVSDNG
ncbi:DUF362 domain-containing protein [Desulfotalea psychrophila]|uniref:DUF362 domain-containing protein n=1 Tax=Desulfotalea psychrophila TaxID=84980 RepID=UPI001389C2EA|nr:DUF362 domain-containing protein [Desulfotalea psychrophila]